MNEISVKGTTELRCLDCSLIDNAGSSQAMRADARHHLTTHKAHRPYVQRTVSTIYTGHHVLSLKTAAQVVADRHRADLE